MPIILQSINLFQEKNYNNSLWKSSKFSFYLLLSVIHWFSFSLRIIFEHLWVSKLEFILNFLSVIGGFSKSNDKWCWYKSHGILVANDQDNEVI